ncbi:restriction endonuclease subunit S [Vibrio parahaemolyticus]|nr:restriction endonuclease subunit S [Vibrio parahaemolyticus]EJL6380842.1 restriction endonuclease subunit S [Vibrio parahaemolyticus]ELA7003212.1 restriction endonuclease subunit S [Vibrio parahaemolyticus]
MSLEKLITDNIDTWTSTVKTKSTTGRGSSKKLELYGVKKLRELILELAVRGKLVFQEPNDEPASVLLERIAQEKAQLVKEKKIKKPKALPDMDEEKPFLIPSNWSWSQLGFLTNYGVCEKAESTSVSDDTWVLELEDVEKTTSKLLKKVRFSERAFKSSKNQFQPQDVLYGKLRPYLDKVLIADEHGVCTTEMIPVRAYRDLIPSYLRLVLKSPYFINYANDSTHGMNLPRMGTDKARAALFPLAPLSEQHRIVAKVDELMTLCDQLEQQTEASIEAHQVLATTLLDTLTNSANAQELMQNWQMVAEHFETLFTTEESIDQLKQTILQLAVMGKLVPQDPNDEPAANLLERIAEEKAQLIKDKKIKKQKALPPITEDEKPFELPNGWEWVQCVDTARPETTITYGILKPVWKHAGVPTVRIKDMVNGSLVLTDIVYCCPERASKFDKTTLIEGDLLIAKDGATLGKTAFVPPELAGGNVTQHVLRFSISPTLNKEFIRLIIDSPIGQGFMKGETKGVALPGINVGDFRKMPIALPPLAEQQLIVEKVEVLLSICNELKQNICNSQQTQFHLSDAIVEQAI